MALSRAIFREYDIRGVIGKDLTQDVATALAGAYAGFLAEQGIKRAGAVGPHNPPEYNGFKLGLRKNSIYGADIQHLYVLATAGKFPSGKGALYHQEVTD